MDDREIREFRNLLAQLVERFNILEENYRNLVSERRNQETSSANSRELERNAENPWLRGQLENNFNDQPIQNRRYQQRQIQINQTNPAERIEQWKSLNDFLTNENTILGNRVRLFQNQLQQLNNLTANNELLNKSKEDLLKQLSDLQNEYVTFDVRPPASLHPLPPS
jgi:hypothetical protein